MAQKVRDVMTARPIQLGADRPVFEAARLMREADMGDVLVTRDGALCGIVTDRDIVVRCLAEGLDPTETPLERICSGDLVTLSPEQDADEAVRTMQERAIRRIPVVEDGRPVGIVALGDLAAERDRSSTLGRISTARPNQ